MISMDKKYKTRDGRSVRLLCVDRCSHETRYTVIALVGEYETLETYTEDGRASGVCEIADDLIEVPEWCDFEIDEPVMVSDGSTGFWFRRFFARVSEDNEPIVWVKGAVKWSAEDTEVWEQCRRPTEEELLR